MKAAELLERIEKFRLDLARHHEIWRRSLDRPIARYPVRNADALVAQSTALGEDLGLLRPYLRRFRRSWVMHQPGTDAQWDALEAATGLAQVAQVKGRSLNMVLDTLNQIVGELRSINPDDDIPRDPAAPMTAAADAAALAIAYLPYLHPSVQTACASLLSDGYYAHAAEEAVKAVLQHLRDATGLKGDGVDLVNRVFSTTSPVLSLGDLDDTTTKNEQIGLMEMVRGFVKGVRHPLAHSSGRDESPHRAFEYLAFASVLCRRIDDASASAGLSAQQQPTGTRPA